MVDLAKTHTKGRQPHVGELVWYVDHHGNQRQAFLTAIHGDASYKEDDDELVWAPSVNVVLVSLDSDKTDSYGRQIERDSSVPHATAQPAMGNYWHYTDERVERIVVKVSR